MHGWHCRVAGIAKYNCSQGNVGLHGNDGYIGLAVSSAVNGLYGSVQWLAGIAAYNWLAGTAD